MKLFKGVIKELVLIIWDNIKLAEAIISSIWRLFVLAACLTVYWDVTGEGFPKIPLLLFFGYVLLPLAYYIKYILKYYRTGER